MYKSRQFDEAKAKYEAAFALEPTNSTFLLNITAVIFEQGQFEECIVACERTITHLAEHNPRDFTTLAKAITRKGSCLQKLKRYDEAVAIVLKSRRASISSVQRHLRIGYNRAARLIEEMERAGLVSPMQSNGNREVLAPANE